MEMNVTDSGLVIRLGDTPVRIWTFGEDNEYLGVSPISETSHSIVHIAVDPFDPDRLNLFTYGNVRK